MFANAPTPPGPCRWGLPEPASADPSGLLGFGADLEPATLVMAYRHGIFPWPHAGMPLPWFSPDPRAVIAVGRVRVSRSLRARLRSCEWTATVDAAFDDVVAACAARRDDDGTWIVPEMQRAYRELHALGWAHSVEVWSFDDELVGGLYGVQVGGCFTGESMFHRVADASKAALVELDARFGAAGGTIVDCQLPTDHLASMGARAIDRVDFLDALAEVRDDDVRMELDRLPTARLLASAVR